MFLPTLTPRSRKQELQLEMYSIYQILFRSGGSLEVTMSVTLICKMKVNYDICLISNSEQDQTC